MRIASYNVEWFNALFDKSGKLALDDGWSRRHGVTRREQLEALRAVFQRLDADAVMVIEGPDTEGARDTTHALEQFADWAGLRACAVKTGFINETRQEIALLYDPLKLRVQHDPKGQNSAFPIFNTAYHVQVDDEPTRDVTFSKPPLELALEDRKTGFSCRLIGVHIKSKSAHGAKTDDEFQRISIENRRKQLAQSLWLRGRIEDHLSAGDSLIVLGDFNDGPGLDHFEKIFGKSSVEIVMGAHTKLPMIEPNAATVLSQRLGAGPSSARFYIHPERRYFSALLDYVMMSPDLARHAKWRIWHPFDDRDCYDELKFREALLHASDHFPVTVDLALPAVHDV
jgi:hypothetical protein